MPFVPFELERWQSTWENRVKFNISESGVHPLSIAELLSMAGSSLKELGELRMVYSQSNGTDDLRKEVAKLYPGASPEQVLVTVGSAEANFIVCWGLIAPGDRVAIQLPTYMQTPGMTQNLGAQVVPFTCTIDHNWEPDLDEVRKAIAPGTKLVVVTNPNNPSGHVLSEESRREIVRCANAAGAWLLCDEVFQGAERNGVTTKSFWGEYEKVIVVNGLSKAYGLPGLRIGWIVAPQPLVDQLLERHDYTVIGPSPISDFLATLALRVRPRILERTRKILNDNYPVLEAWLKKFGEFFEWHAPDAGAIVAARYRHQMGSLDLVERMLARRDVLMVPGEHFGSPKHLRLGFGAERQYLESALAEVEKELRDMMSD
ncbi:MAG: aminotransferase class I/II-fold pyridoxal phosphate-dependent enzyme [Gemmatimonadetes bacterium]|nr:aminotransferase class I/II-fold pyridoxal phosphate-dependent enzyme [Gemmatimonadota bacterium]